VGDPFDEATTMGALINQSQADRVQAYIEHGRSEGATVAVGGTRPPGPGYFVNPTLLVGADNTMRVAREEIFGPVATIIPFDDDTAAVAIANDSEYALAATLWTPDLSRAHTLAARIRAGSVAVNGWAPIDPRLPWGGSKQSGAGRELGWAGIEANTEEKTISIVL
jgi:betaine-aldehyde dehydrogenase